MIYLILVLTRKMNEFRGGAKSKEVGDEECEWQSMNYACYLEDKQ